VRSVLLLLALTGNANTSDLESKPIEEVLPLARSGNIEAIHHLCFAYKYGEYGAKVDEDKAFEWCTRSHQAGEPSGTTLLAEIHSMGSEKRRDLPRAEALYRQAAEAGHAFAMYAYGVMLLDKEETAREALTWLNKAHEAGIPEATALLDRLGKAADKSRAP
jgi:TPR repeat protein